MGCISDTSSFVRPRCVSEEGGELRWYADNSELNGVKGAEIPDILLFGGLMLSPETEKSLRQQIEEMKKHYSGGNSRAPVKWNLKDLRPRYEKLGILSQYDSLMASSKEWRPAIFSILSKSDCMFLVACIEGYSPKRQVLKDNRDGLTRYVFTNGLMRFGLHVSETKPDWAGVVLDWPDGGQSLPFDSEYAHAFNGGKVSDGKVSYQCGPLNNLGFADSVMYTNSLHSTLLQAADLVVGASREFVECCIGKRTGGLGLDCLRIARDRFRGAPKNILGWGLVLSSGNDAMKKKIRVELPGLLYG